MYKRSDRFLTDEESSTHARELAQLFLHADHEFGENLDAAMIPWLKEIMNIPGIMPIASCEGHPRPPHDGLAMIMLRFEKHLAAPIRDTVHTLVDGLPYDLHADYYWMRSPYDLHADYYWMRSPDVMSEHLTLVWEGLSRHKSLGPVMGPMVAWLKEISTTPKRIKLINTPIKP